MKSLRKYFLYILLFFTTLYSGDRFISFGINKFLVKSSNFRYSRLYRGEAKADILLIGNSRGLSFYQPIIEETTRHSTFNLSYNGLPTNLALALFKDYLINNGTPKLVIIELTMRGEKKELVSNFGMYEPYSQSISELIKKESSKISTVNKVFNLTRYNGEVFHRCLYYLNKSDIDWLINTSISERSLNKLDSSKFKIGFDEQAASDFKEIASICKSNNIQYKFVINPYLPAYLSRIEDFELNKDELSEYLQEPIYDFKKDKLHIIVR